MKNSSLKTNPLCSNIMATDDCGRIIKKEYESDGDEVVFETNIMKCEISETEMVSESGKYDTFGSEMVTHYFGEKCDIDYIKSENVINVYHEPKSEKCIEEISEGPQNKFLDIQDEDMTHDSKPTFCFTADSGNLGKTEDETVVENKEENFNEKKSSALYQKEFGSANDNILKLEMEYTTEKPNEHTEKKPYQCKICLKSFIWKSRLKIHEKTHAGEKSFPCKICLKSFFQRGNLRAHERTHTGEKPFQCKICSKSFTRSSYWRIHEKTHSEEKPFRCKICLKSFIQNNCLKRHETTHTGEKPFQCKICSKSFTRSSYWRIHEKTHSEEKPFRCKICLKSFIQNNCLKRHETTHTGEKPFQCKICLKSFNQSSNLKTHEKTHS